MKRATFTTIIVNYKVNNKTLLQKETTVFFKIPAPQYININVTTAEEYANILAFINEREVTHTPTLNLEETLGDVYIDMDGVLTPYDYEDYNPLNPNNWLLNPHILCKEPHISTIPHNWIILTKYSTPKEALLKYEWAHLYFPHNKIILVPPHTSKADLIHPNTYDILIDDYNKNIDEWIAAGGCAVKYLNGINSERDDVPCVTF